MDFLMRKSKYGSKEALVNYHERLHIYEEMIENGSDDNVSNDTVENIENENIYDVGVSDESLHEKDNDDESTRSGDSVYYNFEEENKKIALHDTLWGITNKKI